MPFIPNTDSDRKEMLDTIGVENFDELIGCIPQEIRLKKGLNLPKSLSEYEIVKLMQNYSEKNITANTHICFMGGGSYDHFIPAIVGSVLERPEFKTAYTPYQAEVSQGTLQVMYEYQSMISMLTGMDVSNASQYDGATALAESCLLSFNHNKKKNFLIAGTINPNYQLVAETITDGKELNFITCVDSDGLCDLEHLKKEAGNSISAIIVQQPNFFGNIEDVFEIEKIAHSNNALFIVVCDPISLSFLQSPGDYNADIAVGEGQSLGIPMNFGGPYLGFFAAKNEFIRKIPGRICGITQDTDGNRGFVLTLQTREQQIKREKATSNICTNQGLMMLASTVYLSAMGKQGIKEVAEQCYNKAHYLASKIAELPGFSLYNDKPFFKEFMVKTPIPAAEILKKAEQNGYLAGICFHNLTRNEEFLLIAVTEKRSKQEIDDFVDLLKSISK